MLVSSNKARVETMHKAIDLGHIDMAINDIAVRVPAVPAASHFDKLPGFFGLHPEPHEGR